MVMKGDFYVSIPVDQTELNGPVQKIKNIPGDNSLIWVKPSDSHGSVYQVTEDHKLVKKVDEVNEKPLLIVGDTLYLRQSQGIATRKGSETTSFEMGFVPKRVIMIEHEIDMVLVVGHGHPKSSLEMFLLSGQEQTIKDPILSLLEIFTDYSLILDCKSIKVGGTQKLVFAVYHPKANAISLATCVFENSFKLLDIYKMKVGTSLTDFTLSTIDGDNENQHNILALLVKNGQKLQEVIIGGSDKSQNRLQCRLYHTFCFKMKAVQVIGLEMDRKIYLVRDQLGKGFIFKATAKQEKSTMTLNRLQKTESPIQLIVSLETGILFVTSQKKKLSLLQLAAKTELELLSDLIENKNYMAAYSLAQMLGTPQSEIMLWECQLKKKSYRDADLLQKYLTMHSGSFDKALTILKTEKLHTLDSIKVIVNHILSELKRETKINDQTFILKVKKRLKVLDICNYEIAESDVQSYLISPDFVTHVVNRVLYTCHSTAIEVRVKALFKHPQVEVMENYSETVNCLPLELLSPHLILQYLPPGKLETSAWWATARKLIGEEKYQSQFVCDREKCFERMSLEYLLELNLPGTALILLQEAALRRQIWSLNLPWIALESAERSLFKVIKNSAAPLKQAQFPEQLPEDRQRRINILFETVEEEISGFEGVQKYFDDTKWLMALDYKLYERYLSELKQYMQTKNLRTDELLEAHANPKLLALTEVDLVQVVMDIIYIEKTEQDVKELQDVECIVTEMSMSDNQRAFINKYFKKHVAIAEEMVFGSMKNIEVTIQLKTLLRWQMDPENGQNQDEVKSIVKDFFSTMMQENKMQQAVKNSLKSKMKDVTMRTGTEMIKKSSTLLHQLSHGVKGFGARPDDQKAYDLSASSPTKVTEDRQETPDAGKWSALYQSLHVFTQSLGYMIDGQADGLSDFVLGKLFSTERIQSTVVEQLIQHSLSADEFQVHIPIHKLREGISNYVRKAYLDKVPNSDDWSKFFTEFTKDIEPILRLLEGEFELQLLKVMRSLHHGTMLIQTPFQTIRESFLAEKSTLVSLILRLEGLKMYPESLEALCQLNEIVADKEKCEHRDEDVIMAVLEQLDRTGGLREKEHTPTWLGQLVDEHVLQKSKNVVKQDMAIYLLKVIKLYGSETEQNNAFVKKIKGNRQKLMSFLMSRVDKQSKEFAELCELKYTTKLVRLPFRENHITELSKSLGHDQQMRAKFHLKKLSTQMTFEQIIQNMSFSSRASLKRLLKFADQTEPLQRLSELKMALGRAYVLEELSISELINLVVLNPDEMESLVFEKKEQQRNEKAVKAIEAAFAHLQPIERLVNYNSEQEVKNMLASQFADGPVLDVTKLYHLMGEQEIKDLGQITSKLILENYPDQINNEVSPDPAVLVDFIESSPGVKLNVLVFLKKQSVGSGAVDSLGVYFPVHLFATDALLTLAAEVKRVVSDANVLSMGFVFDTGHQAKASLICLVHYINKLELTYDLLLKGEPIDKVYSFVNRDVIMSLMGADEDEKTQEAMEYINDQFQESIQNIDVDLDYIKDEIMIEI